MNRLSRTLMKVVFSCCLSAIGLSVAFAQAESRPGRADQVRQTLSSQPQPAPKPEAVSKTGFTLEDGTVVKLKLMRDLDSSTIKDEEAVEFEVIEDVKVNGVVVIPRGAKAEGTVIEAQAARRMGRTGRVGVRLDYVFLANDKRAKLRAISARSDGSQGARVAENTMIAAQLFFPVAPFFLLQKGKEVTITKETLATAFIDGDHPLERDNFPPAQPNSTSGANQQKP